MGYERITVGTHSFSIVTQEASPERDQLEISIAGGRTVLWGERYRDRLWLWTASGRQVTAHTLHTPLQLPPGLNPVVQAAASAAARLVESGLRQQVPQAA